MLMLCGTCFAAAPVAEIPQEPPAPPTLEPPEHLQKFGDCDGERVLYFTEADWAEFSALVYAWAEGVVNESVATAVTPLLIENAGLKEEVKSLRKPRRGTLYWILGAAGAGLVTGLVVGAVVSR
jgi:hypothetical protein